MKCNWGTWWGTGLSKQTSSLHTNWWSDSCWLMVAALVSRRMKKRILTCDMVPPGLPICTTWRWRMSWTAAAGPWTWCVRLLPNRTRNLLLNETLWQLQLFSFLSYSFYQKVLMKSYSSFPRRHRWRKVSLLPPLQSPLQLTIQGSMASSCASSSQAQPNLSLPP